MVRINSLLSEVYRHCTDLFIVLIYIVEPPKVLFLAPRKSVLTIERCPDFRVSIWVPLYTNLPVFIHCSAAIVIKNERSTDQSYSFGDYLINMEKGKPEVDVSSSLSEAVRRLSVKDNDLKQVQ